MHPIDRETVGCHDITLTQWSLLRALCEESAKALTMGYLAGKLGLTPSGVTRWSNAGLSRGEQKPGDQHVCCLEPTTQGFSLWEEIRCECAEREGKLIEHLSKEESENFVAALEELARAASTESKVEN
jgi:DNA-binding MarR family transcriptional regulator